MTKATTANLVKTIREMDKRVGDVVHVGGKPHYIYGITKDNITLVSMCERKLFVTLWG